MSTNNLFTPVQRESLDKLAGALYDARRALESVRGAFSKELQANETAYDAERELFCRLSLLSDSRHAASSSGVLCDLYEALLTQAKVTRAFGQVNP